MTAPRVSVVIPTIGRVEALARCLDALAAGTLLPAETIVVDQSGHDEIGRILAERRQALPRIRHIVERPRGLSAARNVGARAGSGSILAFTDEDCVPDATWVEQLTNAFAADQELAAVTGPMLPLGPDSRDAVAVSSRTAIERRLFSGRAMPWVVGTGGNTAIRREWLERLHGYDERLGVGTSAGAGEDLDLFRRLLTGGGRVLYHPAVACRHERKTRAERRERRTSYGTGAGAALGRWLRDGDGWALVATARWLALRARMALATRARADATAVDEVRVLVGTARGLVYGLRLPPWGRQM
jgi:GT2 family glycosyltransferase